MLHCVPVAQRNTALVVVLMFVTCGLYWFYWIYATTSELRAVSRRDDLNPAIDLLVSVVTCGLWGIYVEYRNAQIVHEVLMARGVAHEDKSNLILILNLLTFVVGVTGIIAVAMLQEEYNRLG